LNHAELTFFVIQMLEFIRMAQDDEIEELENKRSQLSTAQESFGVMQEKPHALSAKEIETLNIAIQYYLFMGVSEISFSEIFRNLNVGTQTTRKYTLKLEEKGFLKTTSRKPLKFALTQKALEILQITSTSSRKDEV